MTFDLPPGHSCPGALVCLTKVDRKTGKIVDGPQQKHRCFAASLSAAFPAKARKEWRNLGALREAGTVEGMVEQLVLALPKGVRGVRIHAAGDFFSQTYFRAWAWLAVINPRLLFYAYTTSLPFWVEDLRSIPRNLVLTASRGGRYDSLIDQYDLKSSVVVRHPEEARKLGLRVDHDDSLARDRRVKRFALLLHGTQPKGSEAAEAIRRLKKEGVNFSYPSKR